MGRDPGVRTGGMAIPLREPFIVLLMAFVTLGIYYPATLAPFCIVDDLLLELNVLNSPAWTWTWDRFFSKQSGGIYSRPLSDLAFFTIAKVFGFEPEPFHLFNILVHLGSGLLIYSIMKRVYAQTAARVWLATGTALLFLIHPVNVEAVAWVSGRPTVMATFFVILAFLLHLKVDRGVRDWRLWAAAFAYLLSLLSYELAAGIPIAFVYWDLSRHPRQSWRQTLGSRCWCWSIYGFTLAAYIAYRLFMGFMKPGGEGDGGSMLIGVLDAFLNNVSSPLVFLGLYVKKVLWPWPLNFHIGVFPSAERAAYLILGAAFILALTWWSLKRSWVAPWAVWFFCGLLIVLPLSFHSFSWTPAAERYVYLSSIGFAATATVFLFEILTSRSRWLVRTSQILLLLILTLFGIYTNVRATLWQSNVALLRDTWEKNPNDGRVLHVYARALIDERQYDLAAAYWKEAIKLGYVSGPAYCLGEIEKGKQNYAAARAYYFRALWPMQRLPQGEARPAGEFGLLHKRDPKVYLALVDLHYKMAEKEPDLRKHHEERIIHFHQAACKLDPDNAYFVYLLAKSQLRFGHLDEARKNFATVSEMAPNTYFGKAAAKLSRLQRVGPGREASSSQEIM